MRFQNIPIFDTLGGAKNDVCEKLVQQLRKLTISSIDVSQSVSVSLRTMQLFDTHDETILILSGDGEDPVSSWAVNNDVELMCTWKCNVAQSVRCVEILSDPRTRNAAIVLILDKSGTMTALDAKTMTVQETWHDPSCIGFVAKTVGGDLPFCISAMRKNHEAVDFVVMRSDLVRRAIEFSKSNMETSADTVDYLLCTPGASSSCMLTRISSDVVVVERVESSFKHAVSPFDGPTNKNAGADIEIELEKLRGNASNDVHIFKAAISSICKTLKAVSHNADFLVHYSSRVVLPSVEAQDAVARFCLEQLAESDFGTCEIRDAIAKCRTFRMLKAFDSDTALGLSWNQFFLSVPGDAIQCALSLGTLHRAIYCGRATAPLRNPTNRSFSEIFLERSQNIQLTNLYSTLSIGSLAMCCLAHQRSILMSSNCGL